MLSFSPVCASSRLMCGETGVLRGLAWCHTPSAIRHRALLIFIFFLLFFSSQGPPDFSLSSPGCKMEQWQAGTSPHWQRWRAVSVRAPHLHIRACSSQPYYPVVHDICNNVGWGLSIAKCRSSLLSRPPLFIGVHGSFLGAWLFFLREVDLSHIFFPFS